MLQASVITRSHDEDLRTALCEFLETHQEIDIKSVTQSSCQSPDGSASVTIVVIYATSQGRRLRPSGESIGETPPGPSIQPRGT